MKGIEIQNPYGGLPNLLRHVDNIKNVYKLPVMVAVNAFPTDTDAELDLVEQECSKLDVNVALSEVWAKGGNGGKTLAEAVVKLCEEPKDFTFAYETEASIEDKIKAVAEKIYHAEDIDFSNAAKKDIERLTSWGYGKLPVCLAKTQYSFSDNAALLGAPENFKITVKNVKLNAGAGFIVVMTGDILTMPGLPKIPAAEGIDVDSAGRIKGLF